ncbi:MAG TPA: NAD(P)/FAD-dependent oxidoreductase [Candidatus Angelobacter sp.]
MEAADYDLIVAGAGPAGSACAITAARGGARVLLLEKDKLPRHKVCGEFVSPESLHLLESLLGENFNSFNDKPQIGSARVFSGRKIVALPISPPARSISRFELDQALLQMARHTGVDVKEQTTVRNLELMADNNNVRVQIVLSTVSGTTIEAQKSFTARAVVNSTGRWSQLTQPAEVKGHKWIGLKAHYREARPSPTVDLYFFDGGYCGVQPVGKDAVNACAMVQSDAAHSLEEVFSREPDLWQRSRSWEPLFPTITTSPLYFRSPQPESNNMLMAGDAAAFIDPFAGDGISLALHSGTVAAESLLPHFQGKCSLSEAAQQYRAAYLKRFAPAFRNAARVRMMVSAPPAIRSLLVSLVGLRPFAKAIVRSTRVKA